MHISEARVGAAVDKLAFMEELVNDRLLQDRSTTETDGISPAPSTSTESLDTAKKRIPRKGLNVSGPVQPYHPRLKNFWYPVAFSSDLKDDTMVSRFIKILFNQKCLNTVLEIPIGLFVITQNKEVDLSYNIKWKQEIKFCIIFQL